MSKEYYTLREQIDNNGGLLNDESLHFIAKHDLLCELLLRNNRLGEEAFLALPAMGYVPNSNELACYLYMRDDLDCKMMSKPVRRGDAGVAVPRSLAFTCSKSEGAILAT